MSDLIDPAELEKEIDEAYTAEIRLELDAMLRRRLINWGKETGGSFFFAVYSAAKGAWDDVQNDLRKGRITLDQANLIANTCVAYKLITIKQAEFYKDRFSEIAARTNEHPKKENP